jgi:hypothetical protein
VNTAALSKISTAAHAFFHRRLKCVASDTLTARLLALVVARVGKATSAIGAVECYSKESDRCPKWRGPNSKAPDYESEGRTFESFRARHLTHSKIIDFQSSQKWPQTKISV